MAKKDRSIVAEGHAEGINLAISIFEEFGLPLGLLLVVDVNEVGFVINYMLLLQKKKAEHNFKLISKLVSYDTEINGYALKNKIEKLKGVKATKFMLWPTVNEIIVDEPSTGKIHFKSLAGITKTFSVEVFAAIQ